MYIYVYIVCKTLFSKIKIPSILFLHKKMTFEINENEILFLDRRCGVPNTFPTHNQISESMIFGSRLFGLP